MSNNKLFKDHPNLTEYFETSDGNAFYTENMAKNHATNLKDKSISCVVRPVEGETKETAADIILKTPEMDLETAQDYLDKENALDKPRKTVVDALTAAIEQLEKGS